MLRTNRQTEKQTASNVLPTPTETVGVGSYNRQTNRLINRITDGLENPTVYIYINKDGWSEIKVRTSHHEFGILTITSPRHHLYHHQHSSWVQRLTDCTLFYLLPFQSIPSFYIPSLWHAILQYFLSVLGSTW